MARHAAITAETHHCATGRTRPARLLTLAVLCALCLPALGAPAPKGAESVTLRLKWPHQFQFAGYYAAQEKGFYGEVGLDVRFEEPVAGEDTADAVLGGRANFGVGNSDLIMQRAAGKPVVVLAAIFQHSPLVLLTDKNSGIASLRDLVGKRVAMGKETSELTAYLRRENVRLDQMTVVPHPFEALPLAHGKVDAMSAYTTDEPYELERMGVGYLMFDPRSGGTDFYGDCLFTSETETGLHAERVKNFVEASLRGWKYAMDNPEEIANLIFSKHSQRHTVEHLLFEAKKTRHLIAPDVVELGYINPDRWRHIADTYAELDMIPKDFSLAGFIYDLNPGPDLRYYYAAIGGLVALLFLVALVVFWFYRLYRNLRIEMVKRDRAEQRFRLLVERAPFPIAISDPETGIIRFCNQQWMKDFMPDEQASKNSSTRDFYEDPVDRSRILQLLAEQEYVRDFEVKLKRHRGKTRWAYLSAALIDFGGEQTLLVAFNDITERKAAEQENSRLIKDLRQALLDVNTLRGLIPICAYCKRVRNDAGFWQQVDTYIQQHTLAEFSHGVCPECLEHAQKDLSPEDQPPAAAP